MRDLVYILVINILVILLIYKYFKYLKAPFLRLKELLCWVTLAIAGRLQQIAAYLIRKAGKQLNPEYRSLTALARADSTDPYIKLLQDCIQDPDTRNIALTGPYGSGKSSILRSLQLIHPEYHYLNISLATFKETGSAQLATTLTGADNEDKKETKTEESVKITSIEYSILQQLFYHVRHQQIPFSRFKRIKNSPVYIIVGRAIGLVLWLIAISYMIWHEKVLTNANAWDAYLKWPANIWKLSLAFTVIGGAIYLCYVLLRLYNNSKFHKFNLTSGEVEIAPASDGSILNRHLDELLYFFEATNYNILIIEDLDRFDDPEIFVRLRELNNLLNYSRQVGRKISFVYALRDDVFRDEQRTKFFDYIIPVIPIIDHRNSAEKFGERLDELKIDRQGISQSFITDVAAYVNDMRLLLNTVNEFELYQKKLSISPGSYAQLLAMMIFKNKYPKQFAQLHARKGVAFKVLSGKATFVAELSKELLTEKARLEANIKTVSETYLRDKKELRFAYFGRMIESITDFGGSFYTDNYNSHSIKAISEDDELFEKLTESSNLRYQRSGGSAAFLSKSFAELEKVCDPDRTYSQRVQDVTLRQQTKKDELQILLDKLVKKLDELNSLRLEDLFRIRPLQELKPELGKNQLLNYFVSNGYLNEDYFYYLSHFYPGSLSRRDFDFFFNIKENKQQPIQTPLDQTTELISRLSTVDFEKPGILNITLADTLLKTVESDKRSKFMDVVTNSSTRSATFIHDYFRLGKQVDEFVGLLAKWPQFWIWVESDDQLTSDTRLRYLGLLLKNAPAEDLSKLNLQKRLQETLEHMPDFLTWSKSYVNEAKTKAILNTLNIDFFMFNAQAANEPLFAYILENYRYQLNPMMVEYIVNAKSNLEITATDLRTQNLTTVRKAGIPELLNYIEACPGYYVDNVLFEQPNNTQENEATLIYLLNEGELGIERQRRLLGMISQRVLDITSIPPELWPDVLQLSRVEATWGNLYNVLYDRKTLTPELIAFVNQKNNYEELKKSQLSSSSDVKEKDLQGLGEAVMLSPLSLEALDNLLPVIDYYYEDPDLDGLSREQVALILKHDRLDFSASIYQFLQTKHSGLQLIYAENNLTAFFKVLDNLTLTALDYSLLYGSSKLSATQQEALIDQMDFGELVNDHQLTRNLLSLIEKPGFMVDLKHSALLSVFTALQDEEPKVRLLFKYLNNLTEAQTASLLRLMDDDYKKLPEYQRPQFDPTPANKALLYALKEKGYFISTLSDKKGKLTAYTKQKPSD